MKEKERDCTATFHLSLLRNVNSQVKRESEPKNRVRPSSHENGDAIASEGDPDLSLKAAWRDEVCPAEG